MDEQNKVAAEIEEIDAMPAEEDKKVSRETSELSETPEEQQPAEEDMPKEAKEDETGENADEIDGEEPVAAEDQPVLWNAEYVLTEEEMGPFIEKSGLLPTKRKTLIQGGLAGVLCVINLISYLTGGHRVMPLILVLVCAALCGMVLFMPRYMRSQLLGALRAAANGDTPTRLAGNRDGITFGAGEDSLYYPYEKITVTQNETFVSLALSDGQMVCVPKRALSDEAWEELCTHAK